MSASTAATGLPAMQIDHVSRHYTMGESSIRAVDDVSLVVPTGEFLALLGSSGSGKSTLLNLMAGLDRPTSGSIVSGGRNLAELSPLDLARYRRNTVGMVFQSFNLLPRMTLEENVELPLRLAEVDRAERSRRVAQALERVRLGSRAGESAGHSFRRRAHRKFGQRNGRANPFAAARNSGHAGDDHHPGHARAAAGGTLREPHRSVVRWTPGRSICAAHGSARMKPRDLTELAVRNLREAILRNSLTTLGVAVGVASLVAMLSLGVGLQTL